MVTYTNNNVGVIKAKFVEKHGAVPSRVDVRTWFSFLLQECTRPYQHSVCPGVRVRTIHFPKGRSARFAPYANTQRYYFKDSDEIYSDKMSRFVLDCESSSGGRVTRRLREIYDAIFVDELQDLAGYDLDLVEALMGMGIPMVMVGDPRQATYSTNSAAKNRQYRGIGLLDKLGEWERAGLCQLLTQARSFRCNQMICDFADALWPEMEKTASQVSDTTGHDGVFLVSAADLSAYLKEFSPATLRYDRRTRVERDDALNFGEAKGLTFDRVLVLPHGPIEEYLRTGDIGAVEGSLAKFYVAVTRPRYSVAFVYEGDCCMGLPQWRPGT